jgi:hypothetical protein
LVLDVTDAMKHSEASEHVYFLKIKQNTFISFAPNSGAPEFLFYIKLCQITHHRYPRDYLMSKLVYNENPLRPGDIYVTIPLYFPALKNSVGPVLL